MPPNSRGNFTKNSVVKFFNYEIFGTLKHANRIDTHGLFIGNHHYPIEEHFTRHRNDKVLEKLTQWMETRGNAL